MTQKDSATLVKTISNLYGFHCQYIATFQISGSTATADRRTLSNSGTFKLCAGDKLLVFVSKTGNILLLFYRNVQSYTNRSLRIFQMYKALDR